jgi:hypothetical protein
MRGEKNMRKFAIYAALLLACCSVLVVSARSQDTMSQPGQSQPPEDKSKRPSPPAHVEFKFPDGKMLTIDYSSPRMRGRQIYGGLVPYGKEWRVGANEATTFVTDTDLIVGGTLVPAGSYTLFALPNSDNWKLIISSKTGEWGIPYPGASFDFARIDMKLSTLPSPLEDFTIGLDGTAAGCTLRLDWDTTRAFVDISEKK